ncbi:MAG: TlpA disulfide reductase family protein [Gemmatimonadota bacterium]
MRPRTRGVSISSLVLALALAIPASLPAQERPTPRGMWRAVLDLAGGELRFSLELQPRDGGWKAWIWNGLASSPAYDVRQAGDTLEVDIADYAATITATMSGDSLVGRYRNVGNRGPRTIPFRAARGRWPVEPGSDALLGRWDATFYSELGTSPRVFQFNNDAAGLSGTIIGNSGDAGHFWGRASADSFALAHFDGSFVYLLTGRVAGDTLVGIFHAGLRSQTRFTAVRPTGRPHLTPPTEVTRADTTVPFTFAFPDLDGRIVSSEDPRFKGKVVLVDVFGTWCPTCHDAAPTLVDLYRRYHAQGLEIVGLAYEVTGDPATDGAQVRRYARKFGITFPLLLAGINQPDAAGQTLPQLTGFGAFPTTIFLGRDGRVRRIHAGFYGPAAGDQHTRLVEEFRREVERLLREP